MIRMFFSAERKVGKINKNIYGHFAGHLGRCIYEGMRVGKESSVSNTDGVRNDIIKAPPKSVAVLTVE